MKFNLPILALSAVLGFALAGIPVTVHAQTTNTAAATAPVKPAKVKKSKPAGDTEYKGTLSAIDTTANTITVTNASNTLVLAISPTTKFSKKGSGSLADFAVGDKVSGSYIKDATGKMTAYSLHKKMDKAAKTAAATTAPTAAPTAPSSATSVSPAAPMPAGQ